MKPFALNLRWSRRRLLRVFGWPGMVGVGLLAGCMAFYWSAIQPAQARLDRVRQDALSLQEQARHADGAIRRPLTPVEQLAGFYRAFPDDRNLLPWLEKIFALAQNQNISLDQGEYKVTHDRVGRLMRYQMTMPVRGGYPQIRKYLDSLLTEIPIISLEQLQLGRNEIGDPVLEARIRLALYLEQEP